MGRQVVNQKGKNKYKKDIIWIIHQMMSLFFLNEQNYKPGYVVNDHLSRTAVTNSLKRPTWERAGQTHGPLFGLASDGVYMATDVTTSTVVSYTAFPPLRQPDKTRTRNASVPRYTAFAAWLKCSVPYFTQAWICPIPFQPRVSLLTRYISVALSWELPPPDVIWHPALWSPDFPLPCPFVCTAAIIHPAHWIISIAQANL